MRQRWRLPGVSATELLGAALARSCPWEQPGPRLLYLSGELGAGKTTLAAAMLAALGVEEAVRSPSFALIETYSLAQGVAVHVDCYRLQDSLELEQLGLRDYYAADTLWLVEWPERVAPALPDPDLLLRLQPEADGRGATIETRTAAGAIWLAAVERIVKPDVE